MRDPQIQALVDANGAIRDPISPLHIANLLRQALWIFLMERSPDLELCSSDPDVRPCPLKVLREQIPSASSMIRGCFL